MGRGTLKGWKADCLVDCGVFKSAKVCYSSLPTTLLTALRRPTPGQMEDLMDYAFDDRSLEQPRRRSRIEAPRNEDPPFEEEDVIIKDLMKAIEAPPELDFDHLTRVVEILGDRQQTRALLDDYVDRLTTNEWSYERIRHELQLFADSCNPPITHMQARTLAFIEKRKRAEKGDLAALANLSRHKRRKWRLGPAIEDHLWVWITNRWAAKETPVDKRDNLVKELTILSEKLGVPRVDIENWVRAVIMAIAKMQRGRVKITGMPARIVVRAAVDDTAP